MITKDRLWTYAKGCAPATWQHDHGQKVHRVLSSLPAMEASVLLTRAQVTAYRFDHIVPDPAAGPNDKRDTYMEAYDARGDFAPSQQTGVGEPCALICCIPLSASPVTDIDGMARAVPGSVGNCGPLVGCAN